MKEDMNHKIAEISEKLSLLLGEERVLKGELMKEHTSFKIGGPCDLMLLPSNLEQIEEALKIVRKANLPLLVLGKGSNLLVSDEGIRGVVLKLGGNFSTCSAEGVHLYAQSGVSLRSLAEFAADRALEGMEFAHGIPGSLGGAITMNAGAYGGEMKEIVRSVKILRADGSIEELSNEEMGFAYRSSLVQREDLIVLGAKLELKAGEKEKIFEKMKEYMRRRIEKQPLNYPSAGSVFKRPEGYFAGSLIEECGLKGLRYGGAMVSDKHAGFIVNVGNATCREVLTLIQVVQKTVYDIKKVRLEREVRLL